VRLALTRCALTRCALTRCALTYLYMTYVCSNNWQSQCIPSNDQASINSTALLDQLPDCHPDPPPIVILSASEGSRWLALRMTIGYA